MLRYNVITGMDMNWIRYLIASSMVILLVIVGGVVGFSISRSPIFEKKEEFRELKFSVDKDPLMAGEEFNISVSNLPDDANITWFMGDGEIKFGKRCCHSYGLSDFYRISAEARWKGGHGNGTIEVCPLLDDILVEREGIKVRDLRRGWGTGSFVSTEFHYCGVEKGPTITTSAILDDSIGTIDIYVWCYSSESDWGFSDDEQFIATYETITYENAFNDLDLPETMDPIYIEIGFIVWDGRIGSYSLEIEVDYPQP